MFGDIRQCVSEIDSHFVNRYGTESLPTINLHNQLIHSQVMAFLKVNNYKTITKSHTFLTEMYTRKTTRNYMG